MTFWLIATAMLIAAVAVIVPPLLHRTGGDADPPARRALTEEQAATVRVYRERLAELRREHERGHLNAADLEAAETEAKRELLAYAPDTAEPHAKRDSHRLAAVVATLTVPAVTLSLYAVTGRPSLVDHAGRLTSQQVSRLAALEPQQRSQALENYVARRPNAPRAWEMLAATYRDQERFRDAAKAFGRARAAARTPDARLAARQAESLVLANEGRFTTEVRRLINTSLQIDPRNLPGLMLAGQDAYIRGDKETAVERWQRLAEQIPQDDNRRRLIENLIARADREAPASEDAAGGESSGSPSGATPAAGTAITVRLQLSDDLGGQVDGGETVFVFARATEAQEGPPLAVRRTTVDALPAAIELSDAQAMVPGRTLSSVDQVVVRARVSRNGGVSASPGDMEAATGPIATDRSEPVELVIDRRVE